MKSLIVPVSFSANAANAACYAADMALAIQADIHLVNVAPIGYRFEETEESGRRLLQTLSKELHARTKNQLTISTYIEVGEVESTIERICRRLNPFAVVMGASDETFNGGFSDNDIGNAVRHLAYPLLVIPAGATFHAIRHVLLACEAEQLASGIPVPVSFLRELKDLFGAGFDVVNVIVGDGRKHTGEVPDLYKWRETLQELYPEIHFVRASDIGEGVHEYLESHDVDWLMVFPQKHGILEFHRSQSKRIVADCPIPVLSIHKSVHATLKNSI